MFLDPGGAGDGVWRQLLAELGGFGHAAAEQAGVYDASAVIPRLELCGGFGKISGIDFLEQGAAPETGDAHVEDKVNKRVELRLREPDRDQLINAVRGGADVLSEKLGRFFASDSHAGMNAGGVSEADGPEVALVAVGGKDVSLKEFREVQAILAVCEIVDAHTPIFAGRATEVA